MKVMQVILVCALFLISLTGCQLPGGGYPAEIQGVGESPNYPLKAAGFDRAEILTYAPGMINISTAYNCTMPDVQIAATIYVYKKGDSAISVSQQFEAEKANIGKYHLGAVLLNEGAEVFNKNGKDIPALKAQYEFEGGVRQTKQTLYSEIMLIEYGDNFIKLRSTAPKSQMDVAAKKNLELMNAVHWAN
jgi:hypothetical protein